MAMTKERTLQRALTAATNAEVRFTAGDRHLYATDASNYRHVPIGVVAPRSVEDVIATVDVCRQLGVPLTHRGGGTSLAGQTANAAVIVDWSKHLGRVLEINAEEQWARVQPGCVLDDLRDRAEEHGLTFGPDPATHNRCTLGGMLGNNSCGVHSVMAGRTSDNVEELDILLYDGTRMRVGRTEEGDLQRIMSDGGRQGEIYRRLRDLRDRYADVISDRYPDIPRRVSGYNLDELLPENGFNVARALVGSEGTLITILEAKVRLSHSPPARALLILGYPTVYDAADHIPEIRQAGAIGLEGLDQHLVDNMKRKGLETEEIGLLPEGGGWLLVEFGGDTLDEAHEQARELMAELEGQGDAPSMKLYENSAEAQQVWDVRESGLGATALVPGQPDAWPGWEDSAVPPEQLGDYLRDFRTLLDRHRLDASLYGHFGDGCLHCRITFDVRSSDGIANFRRFLDHAADLVVSYGGTLSGEHGDGQARAHLLEKMYGTELVEAFSQFKSIWDPDGMMNPGKIVDPQPPDDHLRFGAVYRPAQPVTTFAFPDDDGSFARATERCVGVGLCRRDDGAGTMCPSYMVTHEERHSTRGRARLLFEMLQPGNELQGWRDGQVKEALDLCLSCKGCKSDCPVDVDMATYKAEFMSQHYRRRLRPPAHYALGLIHWWSRLASRMPGLANATLGAPLIAGLVKRAAGIAPQRSAPLYPRETFIDWFTRRDAAAPVDRPRVVLFADTFTNHLDPAVGKAAVRVLEDAGYHVTLPQRRLCCGRPLYDFGMLDLAKRQLRQVLDTLRDDVSAGTKIVGLEPSCVGVLRDELRQMLPHDHDARRVAAATRTLAEFLTDIGYQPGQLNVRAIVQGHCHHKTVMGMDPDARLLEAMGVEADILDAGCCGLAGSFGFEAGDHYDVSVAAAERRLLPAIRDADTSTVVMADGFSCRTQIAQLQDGRKAVHLATLLQAAMEQQAGGTETTAISQSAAADPPARFTRRDAAVVGVAIAVAAALAPGRRAR